VSKLVTRHLAEARGKVTIIGKNLKSNVTISNEAPYVASIQSQKDIAKAQAAGMKNGLKYMQKVTQKNIEKANRNS
jgi:hypothetical protein